MPTTIRNTDILFNDGTTQSTAASAASTAFGAVGTYAVLMNAANSNLAVGATVAGSSLRYNETTTGTVATFSNATLSPFVGQVVQTNNATYGGGGTSLSGTWRKMNTGVAYASQAGGCGTDYHWYRALYVRIS